MIPRTNRSDKTAVQIEGNHNDLCPNRTVAVAVGIRKVFYQRSHCIPEYQQPTKANRIPLTAHLLHQVDTNRSTQCCSSYVYCSSIEYGGAASRHKCPLRCPNAAGIAEYRRR